MRKKGLALFMTLALGVSILSGCGSSSAPAEGTESSSSQTTSDAKTVTIGYLPITHALAVFEEKEQLEKNGGDVQIELQKFSSWTDLMDALNSGQIDGASVLIELAMGAVSKGVDLKAVALGHKDGNVIVVSDAIQSPEDLKGKTFAIPSNQSSHNILLNDALKNAGLTADDVTITQLAPPEMPASLASGAIDGYCVAEPFGAQAVVQGFGHVLYDSKELWENSVCCAFVLNGAFAEANPDVVQEIKTQYYEAGNQLDKEEAKSIAEKYLGQNEETLETSLEWIHYDELEITEEDYNALVEKVKEYGINEEPPAYSDFVIQ